MMIVSSVVLRLVNYPLPCHGHGYLIQCFVSTCALRIRASYEGQMHLGDFLDLIPGSLYLENLRGLQVLRFQCILFGNRGKVKL